MLVVPTGGQFRFSNPIMQTQIIAPVGLKSFETPDFFDFGAAGCCFLMSCPLESNLLWVSVWVRWLTHVFSATFWGKKINASQHPYRMPSGIDGLFPGLKKRSGLRYPADAASVKADLHLADRCTALRSLHPPPAALPSLTPGHFFAEVLQLPPPSSSPATHIKKFSHPNG
jgi:hypothetical protein